MDARADWTTYELVYNGATYDAMGAAIRNWGPSGEVFILIERRYPATPSFEEAQLKWYTCTGTGCSGETSNYTGQVADIVEGGNLLHPSMAIRKVGSDYELALTLKQKLQPDCDNDNVVDDPDDQIAIDLWSGRWDTDALAVTSALAVEMNNPSGACYDHGLSNTQFLDGVAWVCATQSTTAGAQAGDQAICDNDTSPGTAEWGSQIVVQSLPGGTWEDHPSFDFYGANDTLAVAAHFGGNGNNTPDRVQVHMPDLTQPDPVGYEASVDDWANHPDIKASNGHLHLVWEDGLGDDARILYANCDYSPTVDCTDQADWTETAEQVVAAPGASFAQIEVDGDKQFVAYQYDAGTLNNVQMRVAIAERCGIGAWTPHDVRGTPDDEDYDQILEVGRPSLVLNRTDHIAHIVFAEVDAFDTANAWAQDGDAYWYRKEYTPCP